MGTFIIDLDRPDRPAFRWAAGVLVVLWLFLAWWSWAHWGSPTVDCGREAYVPSVLAQGKTLYKDVWYPYGPAAPYLNSLLFRLFGVHLNVLYVAGLASVLLYALPLFWLASRFCPLSFRLFTFARTPLHHGDGPGSLPADQKRSSIGTDSIIEGTHRRLGPTTFR